MTELEQFLAAAFPGVTVYVVAVTLGALAFRIAVALRNEGDKFQETVLPRVQVIYEAGVRQRVEPILRSHLASAMLAVGKEIQEDIELRVKSQIVTLGRDVRDAVIRELERTGIQNEESVRKAVDRYLASYSGAEFIQELERRYSQRHSVLDRYNSLRLADSWAQGLLFGLGVAFFLAIGALLMEALPIWLIIGYVYLVLGLSVAAVWCVVWRERVRRVLATEYDAFRIRSVESEEL